MVPPAAPLWMWVCFWESPRRPLWVWGVLGGPPRRPPVGVGGFWESPPRPLSVWGVLGGPPRRPPVGVGGFGVPPPPHCGYVGPSEQHCVKAFHFYALRCKDFFVLCHRL
jgi:hypothetical protein